LIGSNIDNMLAYALIKREPMVDFGLQFTRRQAGNGKAYFVLNQSEKPWDGWLPLSANAKSVVLYNPMTGKAGVAKFRILANGGVEFYVQVVPGESYVVEAIGRDVKESSYPFYKTVGDPLEIKGRWTVAFLEGGPTLPKAVEISDLTSWTNFGGTDVENFSGMAQYTIQFAKPSGKANAWLLDLGKICESARVILNGKELATLIGPKFQVVVERELLKDNNTLEIRVSNLMANRIAYLDKQGVEWRKFYNVNFPARLPENRKDGLFDASQWKPKESGLIGPVTITPVGLVQ
jgi:hypothetical protein